MVVSLIPNFNRPMYEGAIAYRTGLPYVTLLTDFADHPPHFWIEPRRRSISFAARREPPPKRMPWATARSGCTRSRA